MIVNLKTGEALDFAAMSDEEIVAQLKDLEEVFEMARMARDTARAVLISRMEAEGATLKLTPLPKSGSGNSLRFGIGSLLRPSIRYARRSLRQSASRWISGL